MLNEITAAALFLVQLVQKNEKFSQDQAECFGRRLVELLTERFENHWFPDKPFKGQGYRCIRVNGRGGRDSTLERAARAAGVKYEDLSLPVELTLWVDPNEVCCRFGESKGSYCTLASFDADSFETTTAVAVTTTTTRVARAERKSVENTADDGGYERSRIGLGEILKNSTAIPRDFGSEAKLPGPGGQNLQHREQRRSDCVVSSATGGRDLNSPRSHPNRNRPWFGNRSIGMGFGAPHHHRRRPMNPAWYGVVPRHYPSVPSPPPFMGHRANKWMHPSSASSSSSSSSSPSSSSSSPPVSSSYPGTAGAISARFQHHWSAPRAALKV